ncbi:MAG TPA: (2Fe-2S) ferredoxin domain-containing protein, partial [Candidatus Bathyarchaeota archaeon]|nr:(2Fe-2S) ferredoxin domain-containing protein [Candidatus Bathyarchaeota archaeon]
MGLRGLRVGEDGVRVNVGMSTCGLASGARAVYEAFLEASERLGLGAEVVKTGCIGSCFAEP